MEKREDDLWSPEQCNKWSIYLLSLVWFWYSVFGDNFASINLVWVEIQHFITSCKSTLKTYIHKSLAHWYVIQTWSVFNLHTYILRKLEGKVWLVAFRIGDRDRRLIPTAHPLTVEIFHIYLATYFTHRATRLVWTCTSQLTQPSVLSTSFRKSFFAGTLYRRSKFANFCNNLMQNHLSSLHMHKKF